MFNLFQDIKQILNCLHRIFVKGQVSLKTLYSKEHALTSTGLDMQGWTTQNSNAREATAIQTITHVTQLNQFYQKTLESIKY